MSPACPPVSAAEGLPSWGPGGLRNCCAHRLLPCTPGRCSESAGSSIDGAAGSCGGCWPPLIQHPVPHEYKLTGPVQRHVCRAALPLRCPGRSVPCSVRCWQPPLCPVRPAAKWCSATLLLSPPGLRQAGRPKPTHPASHPLNLHEQNPPGLCSLQPRWAWRAWPAWTTSRCAGALNNTGSVPLPAPPSAVHCTGQCHASVVHE